MGVGARQPLGNSTDVLARYLGDGGHFVAIKMPEHQDQAFIFRERHDGREEVFGVHIKGFVSGGDFRSQDQGRHV